VSQGSLDLDLQRISSLRERSSRAILRFDSKEKEFGLGGIVGFGQAWKW
jgi:hypothetical protein